MNEPEWLDTGIILDIHAEQLALFGGADGVRDLGLLESALGRAPEQVCLWRKMISLHSRPHTRSGSRGITRSLTAISERSSHR